MADDEEQGRAPDAETPPELSEQRFAENLRRAREDKKVSQVKLAQEMAARGWHWHQQTVTRVESGQRMVRLGEALAVAEILDTSMTMLTASTRETSAVSVLGESASRTKRAYEQIAEWTETMLFAQRQLRTSADEAESANYYGSALVQAVAAEAGDVLGLTPEQAVVEGRDDVEETLRGRRRARESAAIEEWEPSISADRKDRARPYARKIEQDRRRWKMQYAAAHPGIGVDDVPEPPGAELFPDSALDAMQWDAEEGLLPTGQRIWLIAELQALRAAAREQDRSVGLQPV
jgi:transcriptional regulator with XRE-family HTH domain